MTTTLVNSPFPRRRMTAPAQAPVSTPMTAEQREQFERDGYLVIKGALTPGRGRVLRRRARPRLRRRHRRRHGAARHGDAPAERGRQLPEAVGLIDHPSTFPLVWSMLGWNVHIYHSHLDVHPQIKHQKPFRVRVAPGRRPAEPRDRDRPAPAPVGQARLLALRRLRDRPRQLHRRAGQPPDQPDRRPAAPRHRVARPGGRHRRSAPPPATSSSSTAGCGTPAPTTTRTSPARACSSRTRTAGAYGRDENDALFASEAYDDFTPVQKQLLGAPLAAPGEIPGDHQWGHYPATTPLYGHLAERGLPGPVLPAADPLASARPAH